MSAAPKEVWLHCTRDGHWSFSFDPPRKRYAHQFHRMVPAIDPTAAVDATLDVTAELARVTAELARVTAERDEWVLKSADAVTDFVEKSLNKAVARAEKAEKARDELMQQMSATNDDIKQFLGTHAATKERLEKAEKANAAWRVLAERARECLVSTSHHEECGRSDECEDADPGDCGEHGSGGCPACDCGASEWHETAAELHAALKETT